MSAETNNTAPHNPHPFRLQEGDGVGFSEAGERIAVTWPNGVTCPEEFILQALEDAGARFPDRDKAADIIAQGLDLQGDQRAAEALALIFARLPGGRRGEELRAAFLGSIDGETLDETAKRHGVCRVTWFKSITRLQTRLFGKRLTIPHRCEDA